MVVILLSFHTTDWAPIKSCDYLRQSKENVFGGGEGKKEKKGQILIVTATCTKHPAATPTEQEFSDLLKKDLLSD